MISKLTGIWKALAQIMSSAHFWISIAALILAMPFIFFVLIILAMMPYTEYTPRYSECRFDEIKVGMPINAVLELLGHPFERRPVEVGWVLLLYDGSTLDVDKNKVVTRVDDRGYSNCFSVGERFEWKNEQDMVASVSSKESYSEAYWCYTRRRFESSNFRVRMLKVNQEADFVVDKFAYTFYD